MRKNYLLVLATIFTCLLFAGCKKDSTTTEEYDPSKATIKERDYKYDDGIMCDEGIAILGAPGDCDIEEAAALRFLGGIETDVTDNTYLAIIAGDPNDYLYEGNEVLERGGIIFVLYPQTDQMKKWLADVDNLVPYGPSLADIIDLDNTGLLGFTSDGSLFHYDITETKALEPQNVIHDGEETRANLSEEIEDIDYLIKNLTYDDIYDSSEYLMCSGIVNFWLSQSQSTRANADDAAPLPNVYQKMIEVPMYHKFFEHATYGGQGGEYNAKGVFCVNFNILHAFDLDGKGDYYMVDAHYQALCSTFNKGTWQNETSWRRHTVNGDVLKYVQFKADPIPSNGYSVKVARAAVPQNVPEQKTHTETSGFNVNGSLSFGIQKDEGRHDGNPANNKSIKGEAQVSAGYEWKKSVSYVTKEWSILNTNTSSNAIAYSISTSSDFDPEWNGTTDISVKPNSKGTIDINANWVWNVPEPQKNTYKKGIDRIHVTLQNLTTTWRCQVQALPSSKSIVSDQKYSDMSVDIPLLLTNRTEYGTIYIKNGFSYHITRITVLDSNKKKVFDSNTIALPSGDVYTVSLATSDTYNILIEAGPRADQINTYEYIMTNGKLVEPRRSTPLELNSDINFRDVREGSVACIVLNNSRDSKISYIKVIDYETNEIVFNSSTQGVSPGKSMRLFVEPNKKYTVRFSYKRKTYEFVAPEDEDQYILIENVGGAQNIDAEDDFEQVLKK